MMSGIFYAIAILVTLRYAWGKVFGRVQSRGVEEDVAEYIRHNGPDRARMRDILKGVTRSSAHDVRAAVERMCDEGWAVMNGTREETQFVELLPEGATVLLDETGES
jgi:hypothetical protein